MFTRLLYSRKQTKKSDLKKGVSSGKGMLLTGGGEVRAFGFLDLGEKDDESDDPSGHRDGEIPNRKVGLAQKHRKDGSDSHG